MIYVVGMVVVGDEHALLVKALHQHALAIEVGKAERAVNFVAAHFARPGFHGLKQRGRDLNIVYEVYLRKAHAPLVPLFIGTPAENRADTADDLTIAQRQIALCIAILKGRILFPIPIRHVLALKRRHELRHVPIELIRVRDEPSQIRLGLDFANLNHGRIPLRIKSVSSIAHVR